MLARHIRLAGVRLIETALSSKHANVALAAPVLPGAPRGIRAPTIQGLRDQHRAKLKAPSATAQAAIPKVVTTPST